MILQVVLDVGFKFYVKLLADYVSNFVSSKFRISFRSSKDGLAGLGDLIVVLAIVFVVIQANLVVQVV